MRHLVILCHADPSVADRYQAELSAEVGEPVELVLCNAFQFGNRSSAYRQLYAHQKAAALGRPTLAIVAEQAGASLPIDSYATVTVASFSAGYGMVRELLAERASALMIHAVVAIDSWHAGFDADGTAADSQLGGVVAHALRSKEGPRVCWIGHTDVQTPQRGAGAFASTTQTAKEIVRLAGGTGGGFAARAYNLHQRGHDEHVAALTNWGPGWLADAVCELLARRLELGESDGDTDRPPSTRSTIPLGVRALDLALDECDAKVVEIPGPRHHPRILEYLAGCERGGRSIGPWLQADETPWCAAGASWCAFKAGGDVPHKWRAAVLELWQDAIASGAARSKAAIVDGRYLPEAGDLAIMARGGPAFGSGAHAFRATNGKGHVGRIIEWPQSAEQFRTLDGNVRNRWTAVDRRLSDDTFIGVIAYPRNAVTHEVAADDVLEVVARLWEAAATMARDAAGMLD